MQRKARIVLRVSKKAAKRAAQGRLRYKDKGVFQASYFASRYLISNGPKAFAGRLKREFIIIDGRLGNNLQFPNGLVSGVNEESIYSWYNKHGKPVTVVIPSYNDLEVLVPCIKSIKNTSTSDMVRIIIVDDYCQSENREKLEALKDEQVDVIFRDANGGFAKAVNTGLKAANPKHDVVLVNSDIVAHAGWIEGLQYGAYEFGVDTGIVGPKLLYPDGRIQSAGSYRNTEATEWFDHYYRFQDANYGPANVPQYCLATTGACMYVKREFLNYVGILDDKFNFAFEDVDWCLRGWEAGFRTLYFPSAVLTHMESATRGNIYSKPKVSFAIITATITLENTSIRKYLIPVINQTIMRYFYFSKIYRRSIIVTFKIVSSLNKQGLPIILITSKILYSRFRSDPLIY